MNKIMIIAGFGLSLIRFRGDLIKSWLANNYSVIAVAPGNEVENKLKTIGTQYRSIPLNRTGLNPIEDIILIFKLMVMFRVEKPDYLFLYTVKPVVYGSIAAYFYRRCKVYSMITGLGYVFDEGKLDRSILKNIVILLYKLALHRNHKVFFQNPDDLYLFCSKRIISQDKAQTVNGSGVNLDYYQPRALPKEHVFLMIARLLKEKGVFEFIEAARLIKEKYPKVIIRIVGWSFDDNPSAISRKDIDKWKQEGLVEVFGEANNVRPYLADASVYVLPSYREGTPRTVLEAMAMGRPIITTDVPGCRETVKEGVNGFLVPVKDSRALSKAMERFILNPELVERMGWESRRMAEEKYNVHEVNRIINETMGLL